MYDKFNHVLCSNLPPQNNPTNFQRHKLLEYVLSLIGRPEDYNNIINELSPPNNILSVAAPGSFKDVKVGIIGGGLAGLSSAFELRKLGFDITIFEALEDRIGGRVYTYYFDKAKNLYGELGPMRIPISHESTWHYINLFNLNTRQYVQSNENAFLYVRNTRVRNDSDGISVKEKIYPQYKLTPWEKSKSWLELIEYALGTPLNFLPPNIRKEILQIKEFYHPQYLYWTSLNVRQVLELMGLSQGAINLISSLSPFIGEFLYNSYSEILQEDYPVDFSFLYEIVGGLSNLPLAFYKSLKSKRPDECRYIDAEALGNITWKRGNWITAISLSSDKNKVILEYKNKHSNTPLLKEFDYVICAIPFASLRIIDLFPPFSTKKMQAIKEVNYANSQKVVFLCNKRFWEEGDSSERIVGGGSYTDLPITSIWYPSDHAKYKIEWMNGPTSCNYKLPVDSWTLKPGASPNDPGVMLASYNFTLDAVRLGNLEEERQIEEVKRQVERVHGLPINYLNNIVDAHTTIEWNKEQFFHGAFCYFMPDQKRLFSYTMIQPEYNNRVFFAGEHTSATHAWMQGALNSGMKAANALASTCKKCKKVK